MMSNEGMTLFVVTGNANGGAETLIQETPDNCGFCGTKRRENSTSAAIR
jgi:hypothetical protein